MSSQISKYFISIQSAPACFPKKFFSQNYTILTAQFQITCAFITSCTFEKKHAKLKDSYFGVRKMARKNQNFCIISKSLPLYGCIHVNVSEKTQTKIKLCHTHVWRFFESG